MKKLPVQKKPGRPKDLEKRLHILNVAGELFMKDGYDATTMEAIANAAEVAKLTVYNHFGDKEKLFFEVIRNKSDSHAGDELFHGLKGLDPEKELLQIALAFIDLVFSTEAIAMHRIIVAEGRKHPMLALRFFEAAPNQLFARLAQYLGRIEACHEYRFPDRVKSSKVFFTLLKGEPHMRAVLGIEPGASRPALKSFARECVQFFLNAHRIQNH